MKSESKPANKTRTTLSKATHSNNNGKNKANSKKVHRWQGPKKATVPEGCQKVRCQDTIGRWFEEASQIQAGYRCPERNQTIPKVDRAIDPKSSIPEIDQRNRLRLQDRTEIPSLGCRSIAGGCRGIHGRSVRRHQPVCHPCQESHHHAKGCAVGQKNQR